jgi:hypothetical protein
MGYLKAVEPILDTSKPIYTFTQKHPSGDIGITRRIAPFTIGAMDFGFSPFGGNAAPQGIKDWIWGGRILTAGHPDRERDKLMTACGGGEPQRLVWMHDDGYERVVTAMVKDITWPRTVDDTYYVDFSVTWSILETWHERSPASSHICGTGAPIICGSSSIIAGINSIQILGGYAGNTYVFPTVSNPIADASFAGVGGVPNAPDTAPIIIVVGPMGGDFGFILYNYAETLIDANGNRFNPQIGVEMFIPPGATCKIDCGAQKITVDGFGDVTNLKYKPDAQPYWFTVKPGVNNGMGILSNGPNGINAYQTINISPTGGLYPSGGTTFQLRATIPGQAVQTTVPIPFNASPATVAATLAGFAGVGAANVRVNAYYNASDGHWYNAVGTPGYSVMWIGTLASVSPPPVISVPANTFDHGTIAVATLYGSLSFQWTRKYR